MALAEDQDMDAATTSTSASITTATTAADSNKITAEGMSRKEKRKLLKKLKRKQLRREIAIKEREEEEARFNDPEYQLRLRRLEEEEALRMERDRHEFEERERQFLAALELRKKQQEEEEEQQRLRLLAEESKPESGNNGKEADDDWEYVEEGPAEIIWKGNEIIVKKKKVRVPKKAPIQQIDKQETERPISNPLAPQSQAFEDYRSAQEVLQSVAQQVPNFGTEQDKAHCPFHLKTGVCRFGARCSRVHFYPDKSCTLLMKNMYNGPGLAWEQDEGLEYTDEEVERSFEDFYEDVHTEFLKYGEIMNFKVCKNASSHLRGNVYVHYKLLESAVLAYQSINSRYFAGKQLNCEFVNLTRWKVAICGEFMKSRLKTCSRGSACNFIHCFRNPGGDYEWADWDKPAPRYWLKKMASLFGYSHDRFTDEVSLGPMRRYHSRSLKVRGLDSPRSKSPCEDDDHGRSQSQGYTGGRRGDSSDHNLEICDGKKSSPEYHSKKHRKIDSVDVSNWSSDDQKCGGNRYGNSRKRERDQRLTTQDRSKEHEATADDYESKKRGEYYGYLKQKSRSSCRQKSDSEITREQYCCYEELDRFDERKSPYLDQHHDKYRRSKSKDPLPRKKEADSPDTYCHTDSSGREKDMYHTHNKKNLQIRETDLLDSSDRSRIRETDLLDSSDRSRHGRDDKRCQKSRRKNSRASRESESRSRREDLDIKEDKGHKTCGKSSREMKNTSESAVGGGRTDGDENRPFMIRRKNQRAQNHSDLRDTESDRHCQDRNVDRCERKTHSRKTRIEEESSDSASDGGRLRRYEKRSQKREIKEAKVSENLGASSNNTSLHGLEGGADTELEQTYRLAALKKLEEMRKQKDILSVNSRKFETSVEIQSHDNVVENSEDSEDLQELSGSRKMQTNSASVKRIRI